MFIQKGVWGEECEECEDEANHNVLDPKYVRCKG